MKTCFGNLSFPKVRGCSGSGVSLWDTAGEAWCSLFFFFLPLEHFLCKNHSCLFVFTTWRLSVCVSALIFRWRRRDIWGGVSPAMAPHSHTCSPVWRSAGGHRWTWATAGTTASSLLRDTGDANHRLLVSLHTTDTFLRTWFEDHVS